MTRQLWSYTFYLANCNITNFMHSTKNNEYMQDYVMQNISKTLIQLQILGLFHFHKK